MARTERALLAFSKNVMTIEETAQLLGLWMSEIVDRGGWNDMKPRFPETTFFGGLGDLACKVREGFEEHKNIEWKQWKELSKKWLKPTGPQKSAIQATSHATKNIFPISEKTSDALLRSGLAKELL